MNFIVKLLIMAISALAGAYLLPGVSFKGFGAALIFALVLSILNAVLRPLLLILTLPINLLTLGLFTFVLNGLMIYLVHALLDGFQVSSFLNALIFSILLSVISSVISFIFGI